MLSFAFGDTCRLNLWTIGKAAKRDQLSSWSTINYDTFTTSIIRDLVDGHRWLDDIFCSHVSRKVDFIPMITPSHRRFCSESRRTATQTSRPCHPSCSCGSLRCAAAYSSRSGMQRNVEGRWKAGHGFTNDIVEDTVLYWSYGNISELSCIESCPGLWSRESTNQVCVCVKTVNDSSHTACNLDNAYNARGQWLENPSSSLQNYGWMLLNIVDYEQKPPGVAERPWHPSNRGCSCCSFWMA